MFHRLTSNYLKFSSSLTLGDARKIFLNDFRFKKRRKVRRTRLINFDIFNNRERNDNRHSSLIIEWQSVENLTLDRSAHDYHDELIR